MEGRFSPPRRKAFPEPSSAPHRPSPGELPSCLGAAPCKVHPCQQPVRVGAPHRTGPALPRLPCNDPSSSPASACARSPETNSCDEAPNTFVRARWPLLDHVLCWGGAPFLPLTSQRPRSLTGWKRLTKSPCFPRMQVSQSEAAAPGFLAKAMGDQGGFLAAERRAAPQKAEGKGMAQPLRDRNREQAGRRLYLGMQSIPLPQALRRPPANPKVPLNSSGATTASPEKGWCLRGSAG